MADDLRTQTLVDAVAGAVRQRVVMGDLQPGTAVTEQEIADLFGVARPTAKAAIERAVQIGILRRSANKTARVPILSPEEIEDLYRSRIFFETIVVTTLAQKRSVPAAAEQALEEMRLGSQDGSAAANTGSDIALHRALVGGLGSERLNRMYETISAEAHLCIAQERRVIDASQKYREGRDLLTAIRRGDTELACRLLRQQLIGAATCLLGRPLEPV